jgi:hypothetical protein
MKKAGHTNMRLAASFVHMMPSPSGKQHSIACSTSAVREASRSAPWKLRRKRLSTAKNSHRSSSLRRPAAGNTPRKTESPQQPLVAAVTVRVRMGFSSNSQARCSLARLAGGCGCDGCANADAGRWCNGGYGAGGLSPGKCCGNSKPKSCLVHSTAVGGTGGNDSRRSSALSMRRSKAALCPTRSAPFALQAAAHLTKAGST